VENLEYCGVTLSKIACKKKLRGNEICGIPDILTRIFFLPVAC
jgi:hypothetical protein